MRITRLNNWSPKLGLGLVTATRLMLGALFVASAYESIASKVYPRSPRSFGFAMSLAAEELGLPMKLALVIVYGREILIFAVGLCLLAGLWKRFSSTLAAVVSAAFVSHGFWLYAHDYRYPIFDGVGDSRVPLWPLIAGATLWLLLSTVAATGAFFSYRGRGPETRV